MRITSLISRLSKGLALSSNLPCKTHVPNKFSPYSFLRKTQPWKRAFCTAIGETEKSGFLVNVVSREMIKPSSPTPHDKKTVKFSLIDQIASAGYMPMVFFYQNNPSDSREGISRQLKKSLSETLVDFYPLAGRIQRNELVDCSDEGVEFCEAQLSQDLNHFIGNNPSLDDLQGLLPFKEMLPLPGSTPRHKNIALSVQLNHFSCGGTAISVCLHHKIGDGAAFMDFLRAWAHKAQCRVDDGSYQGLLLRPNFDHCASLFPPIKELNEPMLENEAPFTSKERIAMRRLVFDKNVIDELKSQAIAANANLLRPSRVEVVTALLCKHWPNKISSILQVVNLRKRTVPPIPHDFFGNCVWYTRTPEYRPEVIIEDLREATKKVGGKYMKEFVSSGNVMLELGKEFAAVFDVHDELIACNGVSGLPMYEVNFGMGNPIWACVNLKLAKNSLFTMNTQCGQGLEVWVAMLEDDLAKLDHSLSQAAFPTLKSFQIC